MDLESVDEDLCNGDLNKDLQMEEGTDGWTDFPCALQDSVPFGPLPEKRKKGKNK